MQPTPSNILIVEDHPGDVELLSIHLSSFAETSTISTVQTLGEAREALADTPGAIVLLDLGLPDAQGLDGLTALLDHPNIDSIIVLTGRSDEALELEALRLGAQDYIQKNSVTRDDLRRAIRYASARSKRLERALTSTRDLATIGRLVSAYSRQLEAPLSSVRASNEAVGALVEPLRQGCGGEGVQTHLDDLSARTRDIQRDLARACALVDTITSYSEGRGPLDRNLKLSNIVSMALATLPKAEVPRVVIGIEENVSLPVTHDLVIFAVSALIENAMVFAPDAFYLIFVDATCAGGRLQVRVRDHGPGFTPSVMREATHPFFTTTSNRSGLGLTLAREVARAYQGTLELENHPEGGAVVTLDLALSAFS